MGIASKPAVGINGRIITGNETVPGQPVKNNLLDRNVCFTSESLQQSENVLESATICGCGSARSRVKETRGTLDVNGDISVEFSAQEYGRFIRHALGAAVVCPNVSGMAHGQLLVQYAPAPGSPFASNLIFSNYAVGFTPEGGTFGIVYRDDQGNLKYDDNAGAGYAYGAATEYFQTSVATADADILTSLTLELNKGPNGEMFPSPGTGGEVGVFVVEVDGVKYSVGYTAVTDNGATFSVTIDSALVGDIVAAAEYFNAATTLEVFVGTPAYIYPCLTEVDASAFSDADYANHENGVTGAGVIDSGCWIYQIWEEAGDFDNLLFTHHLEIDDELPEGLTINVLRDTVNFLYSGMKVNDWTVNFDSQAYITSTWSFLGIAEYSVVSLAREAKVGDTTIYLNQEPVAFREGVNTGGYLTIGEEQKIAYTAVDPPETSASGLWEITGIPASGIESIQMTHHIGENVDCSVNAADPEPACEDAPRFSSYEAAVAMDYKLIEVLSGSITLNNNIGGDKFMLGSRYRAALREGRANVSGQITVEFDDGQHYNRFIKGEYFSIEFRALCEDEEFTTKLGTYAPIGTSFYLPSCKYNGTTPSIQDDSYLNTDMPFNAYDESAFFKTGSALVVAVCNYDANDSQ